MLQNVPTLAIVAVDTAENEPLQVLGVIQFNIQSCPYQLHSKLGGISLRGRYPAELAV